MDESTLRICHPELSAAMSAMPSGRWGVGVSGGADSVALLLVLCELRHDDLHVIHLDHETRDGESGEDARFVVELAKRLRVPMTIAVRSALETARIRETANLSAQFRLARFELFRQTTAAHSLNGVVLAHHADDQAETVLQRLLRGAGPTAISGMKSMSAVDGLTICRPLLNIPSSGLRKYLRDRHENWREDSSNQSDQYQRNCVRRWLVDRPIFREQLLFLGSQCAALRDLLDQAAPHLDATFATEKLAELPTPLARHAAVNWLAARGAPPEELNRQVCNRLIEMATDAASSTRQHFPGGIQIRRSRGLIAVLP